MPVIYCIVRVFYRTVVAHSAAFTPVFDAHTFCTQSAVTAQTFISWVVPEIVAAIFTFCTVEVFFDCTWNTHFTFVTPAYAVRAYIFAAFVAVITFV